VARTGGCARAARAFPCPITAPAPAARAAAPGPGLARSGAVAARGAGSADTILSLVAAGLGFSLVPALPGGPRHPGVAAWPFREPATEFPVLAMWRETASDHPLVAAFLVAAPRERR